MGGPAIAIRDMSARDLDDVLFIERASFPTPWSRESFLFEIEENPFAWNVVLEAGKRLQAYACLWIVDRELKINNLAVHPDARGRGFGRRILEEVLAQARRRGCVEAALEVRPSNAAARALYESLGFRAVGRRKGYYQDTREDAILMTSRLSP
jgi:ribosomal-protein-alanine N-acetyltransferase